MKHYSVKTLKISGSVTKKTPEIEPQIVQPIVPIVQPPARRLQMIKSTSMYTPIHTTRTKLGVKQVPTAIFNYTRNKYKTNLIKSEEQRKKDEKHAKILKEVEKMRIEKIAKKKLGFN